MQKAMIQVKFPNSEVRSKILPETKVKTALVIIKDRIGPKAEVNIGCGKEERSQVESLLEEAVDLKAEMAKETKMEGC